MWKRATIIGLAILVQGCVSGPGGADRARFTPEELLAGSVLGADPNSAPVAAEEGFLHVSAEMKRFLELRVDTETSSVSRLRSLAQAIIGEESFGLEYDQKTRTASETFATRRGNCLSFSTMFVAMARELGLNAQFQEVEIPPDWSQQDGAYVLSKHVNVVVELGRAGDHVVDFNIEEFRSTFDMREISDSRALAHYNNNIGVQFMQEGEWASALDCFRRSLEVTDNEFIPAWTNLGILYMRRGFPASAEAAYLQALKVDKTDPVAMSNLAGLYGRIGDHKRAAAYRERVVIHRRRNPYYRYQQAREAFHEEDYRLAISHLRYAIRTKKQEDRFPFLLGLCYLRLGEEKDAERWFNRAKEVAATDALKRRYLSKIEILLSAPEGGPSSHPSTPVRSAESPPGNQ